ncbi:hypothetical protein HGK34_19415, partial [Myceligenerans sp. I2]|nr:hypothetical protein [Myceligenerans indicum]
MSFIRDVPTASGARAVQIVHKQGRAVVGIDHIGSAHDDAELAALRRVAAERLHHPGQGVLNLDDGAVGEVPVVEEVRGGVRMVGSRSQILWDVLEQGHRDLGFDRLGDEVFAQVALARIVEPTSKADTIRVLEDLGVRVPALRTVFNALGRCRKRDYRAQVSAACLQHATKAAGGRLGLIMYDCTTLWFEAEHEAALRKVGMSKERRVDPQILVGLLVDAGGFPLAIHCFEGNKAETKTLIPVVRACQIRRVNGGRFSVGQVGVHAFGVGHGELGEGLLPVRGDLAL